MPNPMHATVIVGDVEAFSGRSDTEQMRTRRDMYEEFRGAFGAELWDRCRQEDRGDGLLIVVPPGIAKSVVLGGVLPRLDSALALRRRSDPLLRIRIGVHAGEVHFDRNGIGGHAVNHAFRLVDSDLLRKALRSARSDSALLVSDAVYDGVVRGGYEGIDPVSFHAVSVRVKETRAGAWLHVEGDGGERPRRGPRGGGRSGSHRARGRGPHARRPRCGPAAT